METAFSTEKSCHWKIPSLLPHLILSFSAEIPNKDANSLLIAVEDP